MNQTTKPSSESDEPSKIRTEMSRLTDRLASGQSRLAYYMAGIVLILGIIPTIIAGVNRGEGFGACNSIVILIDLGLATGLLRLRSDARHFALARAWIAGILLPLFLFGTEEVLIASFGTVLLWGQSGALILLLTGDSETWRLIIATVLFAIFSCVLLLITMFTVVFGSSIEPENVNISIDVPRTVWIRETFIIEVQIENLAEHPQILDSIDISSDYLSGIGIENTEPTSTESSLFTGLSYEFKKSISPNDTFTVQFFAIGFRDGAYSGEIDVCINSGTNCSSFETRTFVFER